MASPSQPKSLIFDLEVAPGNADQPDRIFMVGALRPDTGEELEHKVGKDLPSVLDALDCLGQGASFLLGHNAIDHDSSTLKKQASKLPRTPLVDRSVMADSKPRDYAHFRP